MSTSGTVTLMHCSQDVCIQQSLEEERIKKWLQPRSVAHNALCKVALQDTHCCGTLKIWLVSIILAC